MQQKLRNLNWTKIKKKTNIITEPNKKLNKNKHIQMHKHTHTQTEKKIHKSKIMETIMYMQKTCMDKK